MAIDYLQAKKIKTVYFVNHPSYQASSKVQLIFWVDTFEDITESWIVQSEGGVEVCRYSVKDVTKIEWLLE